MGYFLYQNQPITIPELASLFNQKMDPPVESVEGIFSYEVKHKRKDNLMICCTFSNCEDYSRIYITNNYSTLSRIDYCHCRAITVLNWQPALIAFDNLYEGVTSRTILSLEESPILKFSSFPKRAKKLSIIPTDLMILFDDFFESIDPHTGQMLWRYVAKRKEGEVELNIYPLNGRICFNLTFNRTVIQSLDMTDCEEIKVDLHYNQAVFVFGYNEVEPYIVCTLVIDETCRFGIDANVGPADSSTMAYTGLR